MSRAREDRIELRVSPEEKAAIDRVADRWKCERAEALRRAIISFDTNGSHVVSVSLDEYDLGVAENLARRWRTDEGGAIRKAFHAFNGLMELGLSRVLDMGKVDFLARAVDDPQFKAPRKPGRSRTPSPESLVANAP